MRGTRLKCASREGRLESDLRRWYGTALGKRLAEAEQDALDQVLPNLFGYHLLQVGSAAENHLEASRILHRARMAWAGGEGEGISLVGDPHAIPVLPGVLDALLLCHVLEFVEDPRQVLREADRVLVCEGHLVILGFNPWGTWGLRRLVGPQRGEVPWCGRFIGAWRLRDWLDLLGFETVSCRHLMFGPPLGGWRWRPVERLAGPRLPLLGAGYILVARKKMATLTPVRPRWRPRRSVVTGLADGASGRMMKRRRQ